MDKVTQALTDFWTPPSFDSSLQGIAKWARVKNYGASSGVALEDDEIQMSIASIFLEPVDLERVVRVIDFGCGVGRMSRQMGRLGLEVRALDVSAGILEYARDYCHDLANVTFERVDGHGCGATPDEWADLLVSTFVFQHLPSRELVAECLSDIFRCLRPGGQALIQSQESGDAEVPERMTLLGQAVSSNLFCEIAREIGLAIIAVEDPYGPPLHNWYRVHLRKV